MNELFKNFLKNNVFPLWLLGKKISFIKWMDYPTRIKGYIKNRHEYKNHSKTIYIITSPEYGNLGDQAIAIAEIEFAKRHFPNYTIKDISDHEFNSHILSLQKYNKKNDLIFLIGGGNFGNKYQTVEFIRSDTIKRCKNAILIMFPQTFNFEKNKYDVYYLRKKAKIYNENPKLLLMLREKKSFQKSEIFSSKKVLVPDIVLTLKNDYAYTSKVLLNQVGLIFRNDTEKALSESFIISLKEYLKELKITVDEFDTDLGSTVINADNRKQMVNLIMKRIAKCRFIVTDRLHGMIFAYITGTPCLFLNNTDKKLHGVFQWIKIPQIIEWDNNSSMNLQIQKMYNIKHFIPEQKYFDDIIIEKINKFIQEN